MGFYYIIHTVQYYSVICRPSDYTVGRPRAEIRTRARQPRGRDTTPRLPHLLVSKNVSSFILNCSRVNKYYLLYKICTVYNEQ